MFKIIFQTKFYLWLDIASTNKNAHEFSYLTVGSQERASERRWKNKKHQTMLTNNVTSPPEYRKSDCETDGIDMGKCVERRELPTLDIPTICTTTGKKFDRQKLRKK